MASTLSVVRQNVRNLLRDVDPSAYAVRGYVIDAAISAHAQAVSAELPNPFTWTNVATLVASTASYAYAAEVHTAAFFKLSSTGALVEKVSLEALEVAKQNANSSGDPLIVALEELPGTSTARQSQLLWVWPIPSRADTLQALIATVPAALSADTDTIGFSEYALRATEYAAASELLMAMADKDAERLGVSKTVAPRYDQLRDHFVEWEKVRVARQRTSRIAGNRSSYRS